MKKLLLLKIFFVLLIATFSSAYANEFMEKLEEVRKKKDNTTFTCVSCGADLVIKSGEASVKCGFCSTLNKPSEQNQSPVNKQKTLMLNAVESENWEEVAKYATIILEEDPSNYEAWFYKGAAAGWTSRHIDDPSKEISNCFRNAFANSDEGSLDGVLDMLSSEGVDLLLALARGSRNFAQQHGYLNVGSLILNSWQGETMNGHVSKIFGFILAKSKSVYFPVFPSKTDSFRCPGWFCWPIGVAAALLGRLKPSESPKPVKKPEI